ncbi:hypothetical protein GCM10011379_57800 [Filimonas zeae]|uniref:DUF481 domain-containing protein n=2 Tax=Filimonas zeae TaxID=1737353 RepID=A0A917MZV0_9BACT|nr:hypothetical protein GCM10011379_57800 [Filimonas zeae]
MPAGIVIVPLRNMKTRILVVLCLCWFGGKAQFTDSTHYYVSYAATGIINQTNDGSSYVLTNNFKFNVRKKSISLNSTNNWMYGQQNRQLSNNDFGSTLDFNLYKGPKHFFFWGLANYTTSFSLKINDQLQAGAGGAYDVLNRKNALINISNGILYEKSDLMMNDTTRDVYSTMRNSFRLRFHFELQNLFVIESSSFLQNSFRHSSDYIVRSVTSVSVKLRQWLSLTTSLNYNKFNRTQRETLLLNFGLTAEKYF